MMLKKVIKKKNNCERQINIIKSINNKIINIIFMEKISHNGSIEYYSCFNLVYFTAFKYNSIKRKTTSN